MSFETSRLVDDDSDDSDDALCWRGARAFLSLRWHAHDERGSVPCWQGFYAQRVFNVWRVLLFFAMVCLVVAAAPVELEADRPIFFLATFSYVTLLQQVAASFLLCLVVLVPHWRPLLGGLAVAALEIGVVNSVLVCGVYWGLLAPRFEWNQFLVHGANVGLLLLELALDLVAFVPLHALLLLGFNLLYFLLVLLPYQSATGLVVYPGITDFAGAPARSVAVLFGVGAASLLLFALLLLATHLKCQYLCASSAPLLSFRLRARR